jgi:hypothetical protein
MDSPSTVDSVPESSMDQLNLTGDPPVGTFANVTFEDLVKKSKKKQHTQGRKRNRWMDEWMNG